jgi:hypothetical protein
MKQGLPPTLSSSGLCQEETPRSRLTYERVKRGLFEGDTRQVMACVRVLRHEDALEFLRLAAEASTQEDRQDQLESALIAYITADYHQAMGWVENRRGSKPGKRIDDTHALDLMRLLAAGTNVTEARPLARLVLERHPELVGHSFDGTVERLARAWTKSQK